MTSFTESSAPGGSPQGVSPGAADVPQVVTADAMADRLEETLRALLAPDRPVALVNYPNHPNPGDNAIWLGTLAVLRRIGVPVGYTSTAAAFDAQAMREAVGDAPLLLNGGGNFGDLYQRQQSLREFVLERCRDRPIVQLPQNIAFRDPRNLERMRRLCAAHPRFTLLARERRSYAFARRAFDGVSVALAPDMAFGLRRLRRVAPPSRDVLWLGRRDAERVPREAPRGVAVTDWYPDDPALQLPPHLRRVYAPNGPLDERTFEPLAAAWVRAGTEVAGSARVLVTDRLHAHVFALMLGVPHVLLDNSYGKVRATFETWTHGDPLVRWSDDTESALRAAAALLAQGSAVPASIESAS
jgi:exopolysaccharide biosynthesis protein PssK